MMLFVSVIEIVAVDKMEKEGILFELKMHWKGLLILIETAAWRNNVKSDISYR